ncbi:MAG TPA: TonB-dependent receptor [Methylophilus sp.]|nr:TonB-dependent receptor [Methylophilus sp.]HQQ33095.1 TonB-dependent receptor [Methylophilus sp.]
MKSKKSNRKNSLNWLTAILLAQSSNVMADGVRSTQPATANKKQSDINLKLEEVDVREKALPKLGYQTTITRVGKVLQDPHNIPQAVTSVSRQLMDDQQVGSLREALRNVSGLTFNAAEGGRSGDNMMLRGFYTFGDIYLDNMRDTAQYNRETFNLAQVDVLRGSAAMLFGRGQAGGVINQVSKLAELEDENEITASVGEYDYHQVTGDFERKLTDTAAIRVNVMDRYEETYRENPANGDHPEFDRKGIAISFGAGIGTENEFFLNHIYTQTRDVPDYGVGFVNGRPANDEVNGRTDRTFWGGNKTFDDSDVRITTGIFTHKFSEDTQLRTQLRSASYERGYWAKTPNVNLPNADYSVGGNATRFMDYDTLNLQSDFSTKFKLAGMQHQFLVGMEYLKEDSLRNNLQAFNPKTGLAYTQTGAALNAAIAANGVFYKRHAINTTGVATEFDADNYAVFVQDSIEFIPKWNLLLGMRRDEMHANYSSATSPKLSYGENSYRTGLSWHPQDEAHYYLTWSDSFSPTADLYQLSVKPQPPERSKTAEIGAKWLFFDGDVAFRTALYRTTKAWERNTDLESTAAILTKKRRTDGLEVELSGRITDDWEVFGGLALMDAKILEVAENVNATTGAITKADARFEGERARNTPPVTFNMWTTYKLDSHWRIGGGFEAKGERYGYLPTTTNANALFVNGKFKPNTLPGYTRWDAMLAYEHQKWTVRMNVKNLFNKEYYDALYDNGGFSVPGNKRQAIVTTEFRF